MGKKKVRLSLFSTFVQQIQPSSSSSNDYHFIDNEYFPSFNSVDEIEQFQKKLIDKQQTIPNEHNDDDDEEEDNNNNHFNMDMKTFAQQYLVDLPDNLQLSPISSQDICHAELPKVKENPKRKSTTPVKLTSEISTKRQRRHVRDLPQSSEFIYTTDHRRSNTVESLQDQTTSDTSQEQIAETLIIKNEPIESEQLTSTKPMSFGTSEFSGALDNYVQNVHLLQQPTNDPQSSSSRPQRIRKRKKFFIAESESISRPKRLKSSFRKKRSLPPTLTDAEIEQQFGERLPSVKNEHEDLSEQRAMVEYERIHPQTPMEKARAKLTTALGRGHEPDSYLLKIRSREQKIVEIELAIYSTADWYSERTKILTKIEEALRGLRVSWTKIDIRVDDFDIQISTSSLNSTITPPSSISNANSSWFLKILSESGPLIVHIHDRRHPHQRLLIKCPCPECSPKSFESPLDSSLPVIVNASPSTTPTRRLTPPSILNKTSQTNISSLHNIQTTFFNDLISQHGRNIVIPVTQCVLDLALIVSVYSSLTSLCLASNSSKEDYKKKYQQIIDPLKCTRNDNEDNLMSMKSSDILEFYQLIKSNHVNIRNPKAMRNLIMSSSQFNHQTKQQVQCTPIIEFKPISNSEMISSVSNSARVIRLSIAKSALSSPTIRLVASSSSNSDQTKIKTDSIPLVPKQINIIKPFLSTSTSFTPAIKLSNPVLITNKSQLPSTK